MENLNREAILRMLSGKTGNSSSGGGGGDIDLAGYATMIWVTENFVSIDFFRELFRAYDSNSQEILPNDTTSVVASIKAMVGTWTEEYLTALGNAGGGGGGGGGAQYLNDLLDVQLTTPLTDGQALVYNATLQKWVNGSAGVNMTTVWNALAGSTNEQINASHLSTALSGYVTTSAISDMATQTWVGQQGFATQTWVTSNFITIAYFDRLFRAYNNSTLVSHNDTTTTIDNIKAMFGFWTEFYLSALGTGGISSVNIRLSQLADVNVAGVTNGQVLSYNSTNAEWVPTTISNVTSLSALTDVVLSSLTTSQVLIWDSQTSKWVNSSLKTINSQSIIGSGDISVGGGASGNYLPLTGGTLMGSLQIYSTAGAGGWNEGLRMHVAANNWCGVVMCGSDNTGDSGTSAKTWSIHNNDGDFYISLYGSNNPTYGIVWPNNSAMTVKGVSFPAIFDSSTSNSWIYYDTSGVHKSSTGYYSGLSFVASETNYYRIGVLDNGTPVFRMGSETNSPTYKLLHGGESIEIWATGVNFQEGIRIHPTVNNWCGLILCGADNTGSSGTSTNTWGLFNNNGEFYINKNGSNTETLNVLCNVSNQWRMGTVGSSGTNARLVIKNTTYPNIYLHSDINECSIYYYSANRGQGWAAGVACWDTNGFAIGCYTGSGSSEWKLVLDNDTAYVRNLYSFGSVSAQSDIRHKQIICNSNIRVDDIARMPAVIYKWNDGREDKELHVGSIAQDWQSILPEVVLKDKNKEGTLSMQYGVAALVSSIIIARKVVNHEDRIKQLEKENKELKKRLNIA